MNKRGVEQTTFCAVNIYHCDGVVGEAMRMYKGNFIRRSGRVNDYFVSKAIDSEAKKPAKLVIMAKQ